VKFPFKRLFLGAALFVLFVCLFSKIRPVYFTPTSETPHIIDSHLQPDSSVTSLKIYGQRFLDGAYVQAAPGAYAPAAIPFYDLHGIGWQFDECVSFCFLRAHHEKIIFIHNTQS
jgi:hypothetical protein